MDVNSEDSAWHLWNAGQLDRQIITLQGARLRSLKLLAEAGYTAHQLAQQGIRLDPVEERAINEIRTRLNKSAQTHMF